MARILMVVRPSKGGAFGHVARLGRALAERGHAVAVAGPHHRRSRDFGIEVIEIDMDRPVQPVRDLRAIRGLARVYREFRPDLIHAHGSKGGAFARLARWAQPRTPLVLTPHNFAFTNYFTSRRERVAYRVIETALAPLATRTACVCESEARIARRIGRASRVRVVHNGIDPVPPATAHTVPLPEGRVLAAVTEFSPPKGIPTLLSAMPLVIADVPDAVLVIAGDGPQRPEVETRLDALGISDRTVLAGQVPWVPELLERTAVFLAPGWSESFPYAILEAMRAGSPIVATDVGGVSEAIIDGETGLLVPPHDARALATATVRLMRDRELAGRLGRAARARQAERFTVGAMVEGTLQVYAECGVH